MGGFEICVDLADAERRVTRRDVCLACDQCIKRPAMPLACALIVNPDRDFQPCAAKLARMQSQPRARCPHADPVQRAKWDAAELSVLGRPVSVSQRAQMDGPAIGRPLRRGTGLENPTHVYARFGRRESTKS